ncbi:MAG: hypothetical protein WC662_04170, partial [Candidatus Paceibacterota bacterium]
ETKAKEELKTGSFSRRLKGGIIGGINKIENFGKDKDGNPEKGAKGFAKRMTKMAINIALIGAISSFSVDKLAHTGLEIAGTKVFTASALSGGTLSYLGTKLGIGMGIGGAMDIGMGKIKSEKVKKWVARIIPFVLAGGSIAVASLLTGGGAGIAAGLSFGAGYAAQKLYKGKFTNEKILAKEEKAKKEFIERIKAEGKILDENRLAEIEIEYKKILKKFENQRIWGKLLDGAVKLTIGVGVSTASLEASGFARDNFGPDTTNDSSGTNQNEENNNDQNSSGDNETKDGGSTDQNQNDQTKQPENSNDNGTKDNSSTNQNDQTTQPNQPDNSNQNQPDQSTQPNNNFEKESVEYSSRGAIATIDDLKAEIHEQYGDDLSQAPASVQHFMETNSTELAKELGMFNPDAPAGEESMIVQKGELFFDEKGNLQTHYTDMQGVEHDQTLIQNESAEPVVQKYEGDMFDSDKSALAHNDTGIATEGYGQGGEHPTAEQDFINNQNDLGNQQDGLVQNDQDNQDNQGDTTKISDNDGKGGTERNGAGSNENSSHDHQGSDHRGNNEENQTNTENKPEENPYNLTEKQLAQAEKLYNHNVHKIFPDENMWEKFQNQPARNFWEMGQNRDIPNAEDIKLGENSDWALAHDGNFPSAEEIKLAQAFDKLWNETRIEPAGETPIRSAETVAQYLKHTTDDGVSKNILNKIRL